MAINSGTEKAKKHWAPVQPWASRRPAAAGPSIPPKRPMPMAQPTPVLRIAVG